MFDMGGVVALNTNVFPVIVDYLGITEQEAIEPVKELVAPLLEGKIATAEFWAHFSERSQIAIHEELFGTFFRPERNEPVYDLIRQIKTRCRVICATNSIEEHYAIHEARGDYDVFDRVYASHRIGISKPDPAFYHHILHQEHVFPSQAVFIDDALSNIEAAREIGIEAYHFTSYEALVQDSDGFAFSLH